MNEGPTIHYECYACKYYKQTRHVDTEADEEYFECECLKLGGNINPDRTPAECPFLMKGPHE